MSWLRGNNRPISKREANNDSEGHKAVPCEDCSGAPQQTRTRTGSNGKQETYVWNCQVCNGGWVYR